MSEDLRWYVVHTYSGYENKVKANIEKIIENRAMQDQILEVVVPVQDVVEIKNGQKKSVQRKVLPGYVLVKMMMNDDTWYVVRNTRGVTSFVGPGSKPVPLSDSEVLAMGIEKMADVIDVSVGDTIKVMSGPLEGTISTVKEVNLQKQSVLIGIIAFGRETPVEIDFTQIIKM